MQTDWVKLLFREKWETPETGEVSWMALFHDFSCFSGLGGGGVPWWLREAAVGWYAGGDHTLRVTRTSS